jgi:ligand-binding sensor domain-containing protein/signal transduction histidine kinase
MIPATRRLYACWSAFLILLSAAAGRAASANVAWSVHAWQMDDGLPNNTVTSLAQTADGYLWVANPSKLARFDGVQFETFSPHAFGVNSSQGVRVLLCSRAGGLWLAMDHGAIVHANSGSARVLAEGLPALTPQTVVEDEDGSLWIAYNDGVVYRVKGNQARKFAEPEGLPEGPACSLARDKQGRIWFAKSGGADGQVGIFQEGQFHTLLHFGRAIIRLAAARGGGIWICSGSQLFKYNAAESPQELGSFLPKYASTKPRIVLEDSRGVIWIGTSDSGLFRCDGSEFENVPTSHPAITDLLEDHEGNLWVATSGGGLNRIQPRAVELEGTEKGLPYKAVVSLCEDTNGVLWAATQNGLLVCRKNGAWNQVATNAEWAGADVDCVAADHAGAIWIGTKDHAVYCLRDGHFTVVTATDGLASRTIRSLLVSSTGDLWMGGSTPTTLQCLRHGKVLSFDVPIRTRSIRAMAEDAAGNIWVGASGGGLLRIRQDVVTEELAAEVSVLPGDVSPVRSLCTTADGSLWIGYAGAGLGRLKNGRFARITAAQGLFDDHVSQIISDDQGWLWFGADHGIFKIKQAELDAVAEGKATRVRSTHYGRDQGLSSLQASFDAMPGAIRSRDNRLWIPMRTALAVINPMALREDSDPPAIVLRRVTLDERTIAAYGGVMPVQNAASLSLSRASLRLPPRHRRLEFDFTALNLSAPENVHFRYRLESFDDDWVEADTRRSATYPQLPAGSYRFHAAACSSDGLWNELEEPLAFVVTPFLWQTGWFRAVAIITFTLAVAAIVRYLSFRRLRFKLRTLEQQAALDKERTRIARDLHDDLGGSLTQVSLLLDKAQRDLTAPNSSVNGVKKCSSLVQQVARSVDEIIWAINPRNDTLRYLIDYISQFVVEFLHTASIRCRVELPDQIPDQTVSPEARHNLLLVVKETLNNIARHSRASEARLRVTADETQLSITIEDNGQGFDSSTHRSSADGLRNMRQRMEEIGGQCRIESKPEAGARVSFLYQYPHD